MTHLLKGVHVCLAGVLLLATLGLLSGCSTLPDINEDRRTSTSLVAAQTQDTLLGRAITPLKEVHADNSGVYPLSNPREAFAVRVLLARKAERTLDLQYYIWHDDTTGRLLLAELLAAAERNVRVRLLLDDNGTAGLDHEIAALNAHPNIEIRLFNPYSNRRLKALGYVTDFSRLNRRMHNKSMTADSQAMVIGGRNIGDDYFGATTGVLKADLDALIVGPVVDEVSLDFDKYWASPVAYPADSIVAALTPMEAQRVGTELADTVNQREAQDYIEAIRNSDFFETLMSGNAPFLWSNVQMVTDDPAKALGNIDGDGLLMRQLETILARPESSVVLVSPYFVPTQAGTDVFVALAARGVDVRILTNALESTDVLPVHAGYAKRRKALLAGGVKLFEMMRLSAQASKSAGSGPFGSSASSLHAKTFAIDGRRVFIGSFNFDPRSMHLNTELGFVIESPELAEDVEAALAAGAPEHAYEVRLDENGRIYWIDQRSGEARQLGTEPNTSWFKRGLVAILGRLPIEWLL